MKHLSNIELQQLKPEDKVACFCIFCKSFICTGEISRASNDVNHISMDVQRFKKSNGWRHQCNMHKLQDEDDFAKFNFYLIEHT